ncbi:LRR receptor-like serine/threonine-protein kinase GSO1 [Cryptomeria japonica]|uniref:LRR receptor-like serine/threonine-protein kinase GSO1 n=1 Tax=Cryptomeria japonica TaxID=3369 RepID=UPI0027D9D794|nr:LRR receptor-like serine/threonine-protein kinase GSO1 [Cryptomeria japonica]
MAWFTAYLPLISVLALAMTLKATPIPRDAESLLALKQSFAAFPLHDWRDRELSNFCNWTGVTCDHFNHSVIALNLQNKAIFGSLPLSFPTFTLLTTLNLSSNSITGAIQSSAFASCSALAFLSLDRNNLTGTFPLSLSNCTALQILDLSMNRLTGSIPSSLSKLSKLKKLIFQYNNFTGPIPNSLSNCTNLVSLDLCYNYLINGTIPAGLGLLTRLQNLCLSGNRLTGPIPAAVISNLTQLRLLGVGLNDMSGPIPSWLGQCPYWISSVWEEVYRKGLLLPFFPFFILSIVNKDSRLLFSAWAISGIRALEFGVYFYVKHLKIATFYRIKIRKQKLTQFYCHSFHFFFYLLLTEIPDCYFLPGLSTIIPPPLGKISSLTLLALYRDSLTGNILKSLGQLSRLTALSVSGNHLTGSLPAELGNLSNLQLGRVYGNSQSGSIPTQFGRLKSLQQFEAQDNNFSGRIPAEMSNCSALGFLRLQGNQLSGGIPPQLCRLRFSVELHLEQNQLSGTTPGSLSNCTNLQDLSLSYNLLHGYGDDAESNLGRTYSRKDTDLEHVLENRTWRGSGNEVPSS